MHHMSPVSLVSFCGDLRKLFTTDLLCCTNIGQIVKMAITEGLGRSDTKKNLDYCVAMLIFYKNTPFELNKYR